MNQKRSIDKNQIRGFFYVMAVCVIYGIMPSFTQLAYQAGVTVQTMLADRTVIAVVLMWITILARKMDYKVSKRHLCFMMLVGLASASQMTLMNESYRFLPGAITSLLMFLYVSVVVITEVLLGREKLDKVRFFCLLLTFIGLIFVVWTPGMGVGLNVVGLILVLLAATSYGLYTVGIGAESIRKMQSEVVIGYMLIPPMIVSVVRCGFSDEPMLFQNSTQFFYILVLAVFCTYLSSLLFCKAVKCIGASNASIFNTAEPVFAYIAGILIMKDHISWNATFGGVLILIAIIYLNVSENRKTKIAEDK